MLSRPGGACRVGCGIDLSISNVLVIMRLQGTFVVIRDDRKKSPNSKERGKTKAEIKEEQKAQKEALQVGGVIVVSSVLLHTRRKTTTHDCAATCRISFCLFCQSTPHGRQCFKGQYQSGCADHEPHKQLLTIDSASKDSISLAVLIMSHKNKSSRQC